MMRVHSRRLLRVIKDVASKHAQQNWKQDLALVLDISPGYLSKILTGADLVADRSIAAMARRLGISERFFFNEDPALDEPGAWRDYRDGPDSSALMLALQVVSDATARQAFDELASGRRPRGRR